MGYFDANSPLRRVVSERVMVLAGGRTLLMQAAHPRRLRRASSPTRARWTIRTSGCSGRRWS